MSTEFLREWLTDQQAKEVTALPADFGRSRKGRGEIRLIESRLELVIIGAASFLCLAHIWYLNKQLIEARNRLERLLERFPGVRESLCEMETTLKRESWVQRGQRESQARKPSSKGSMR